MTHIRELLFGIIFSLIVYILDHFIIRNEWSWIPLVVAVVMILIAVVAVMISSSLLVPLFEQNIAAITTELQRVGDTITGQLTSVSSNVTREISASSKSNLQTLQRVIAHLEQASLGVQDHLMFIEDTKKRERAAREVWVATPDFYWDADNQEYFAEILGPNISQGVRYHYFCPKNIASEQKVKSLLTRLPPASSIDVTFVPEGSTPFSCLEWVIYDASSANPDGVIVDILRRRYSDPKACIDLKMEVHEILPWHIGLARCWSREFGVDHRFGTRH